MTIRFPFCEVQKYQQQLRSSFIFNALGNHARSVYASHSLRIIHSTLLRMRCTRVSQVEQLNAGMAGALTTQARALRVFIDVRTGKPVAVPDDSLKAIFDYANTYPEK